MAIIPTSIVIKEQKRIRYVTADGALYKDKDEAVAHVVGRIKSHVHHLVDLASRDMPNGLVSMNDIIESLVGTPESAYALASEILTNLGFGIFARESGEDEET